MVEEHFESLRRREFSAWNACYGELLSIARRIINAVCFALSDPVKRQIENDSVAALYKGVEGCESAGKLRAYLKRTAQNKAIDEAELSQKFESLTTTDATDEEAALTPHFLWDWDHPLELLQRSEGRATRSRVLELIPSALEKLGSPCRDYLEMRFYRNAKEREIADHFKKGVSSMHNRIQQCLKKMRALFEAESEERQEVEI
ncbi:MAG: hypothetical protein WCL11_11075 [Verrucomicrobiota bacterium]